MENKTEYRSHRGPPEKLWTPDKTDLRLKIRTMFDCPGVGGPAETVLELRPLPWGPCHLSTSLQTGQQVPSFTGPPSGA